MIHGEALRKRNSSRDVCTKLSDRSAAPIHLAVNLGCAAHNALEKRNCRPRGRDPHGATRQKPGV